MDEIFAMLRDRLVTTARERLSRARAHLSSSSPGTPATGSAIAMELHALAGEASVVGADEMADAARAAERAAGAWSGGGDANACRARCAAALDDVDAALKRVELS